MRRATPDATARWAAHPLNGTVYRSGWDGLTLSTHGLSAPLAPDADALARYLAQGGNLLDAGAGEAALGTELAAALSADHIRRDQIVICAEGGAVTADEALDPALVAEPEAVVGGYCLAPAFLRQQIKRSLARLGLECLDLYWLRGVEEHAAALSPEAFRLRLREAFAALEVAIAQSEIAAYGLTLSGPAVPLEACLAVAQDVLGERHHLRALKLGPAAQSSTPLAAQLGLAVIASAPSEPVPALTAILQPGDAYRAASQSRHHHA